MGDGRSAKGCGVSKEGLEVYCNILHPIQMERSNNRKFKLAEGEGGKKVVKRKRKVKVNDKYNVVHHKLMREVTWIFGRKSLSDVSH